MAAPAALVLLLVSAGLLAQPLGEDAPLTAAQAPEDRPFGGVLEADRNLLRSLRQADEFAADQRYQDAIVLWQQVLDRAGDSLVPDEGRAVRTFDKQEYHVYQSLAVEVERRLLELPPEALDLYRRSVDGAAAAVLADASRPYEERLTEIVRRFFLSSSGDDAAYGVACLKFDRGDFAGASRLLVRVLHEHPEPTTPREGALARLAIADARLGDTDRALRTADELRRVLAAGDPLRTLAEVAIKETHRREEASGGDARPLALGNPQRSGRMPAVAAASRVAQQTELWTRSVSPELVERPLDATDAGESRSVDFNPRAPLHSPKSLPRGLKPTLRGGGAAAGADATRTGVVVETAELAQGSDAATIAAWIEHGWSPAGQVLLSGSRAYFKGLERLVCCDAGTGRILWMGRRNRFELNWPSQFFGQAGASQSGGSRPTSLSDIQRFGDRVHAEMTLWEGVVYAIEGRPIDFGMEVPEEAAASPPTSRAVLRRLRTNRLSAYDATTGKLRWSRDAADEAEDVGFLAAPVPVGGRLLIPVTDEGELWLYSLQSDTGDTTWKVFLCDEPPGGCSPWSPVGTATEGGTVYVATGAGIVFAVDARTGSVQWAARYPRNGIRNLESVRPGAGAVVNPTLDGWDADVVIAVGRWLVVAPSDYGYLFVLDRRSGRLLWNTPRQPARGDPPADTLLGVLDGGVFVAGRNVVRRYDLAGGRLDWELTIGDSHGRGMLTDDAVCVPVGESIVRLDPADGHELSRSELFSPAREPVGNVYSDGARLLVLGPDRLYALTGLEAQLERLAGRVAVGEPAALLERMRLYDRLGQKAEAVADLEAAGELLAARSVDFNPREPLHSPESLPRGLKPTLRARGDREEARRVVLEGLAELLLAETQPKLVLELIARFGAGGGDRSPGASGVETLQSGLIYAALRAVAVGEVKGAAREVLDVVPLSERSYVLDAARRAMRATATVDDADVLRAVVAGEDDSLRLVAVGGLATVLGDDAVEFLASLLNETSEPVRFAAAVELVNRGRRDALDVLGELLEATDLSVRHQSVATLRAATGQQFGYDAANEPARLAEGAARWRNWILEHGATAELALPVREAGLFRGRTLITYSNNRAVELDQEGQQVWEQQIINPWGCQGLPNGHRLLASYSTKSLYEYDAAGNVIWKNTNLPSSPYSVERLADGNTLVACYSINKVLEISAAGDVAREIAVSDHPRDATRLANGNTLIALYMTQQVVEIDREDRIVWKAENMGRPVAVQRLDNGNTLVTQYMGRKVVEIDRDGVEVWSKEGLTYPYDAQRLPDGNTLIVERDAVREYDPTGRVVWELKAAGATRVSRY